MTEISRVDTPTLRIEPPDQPVRGLPALPMGTSLAARVTAPAGEGRWLIEVAGRQLIATTAMTLVSGDQLDVVASRTGAGLELRVLQTRPRLDETQYAAATLVQAGAREARSAPFPSAASLLDLLRAAAGAQPAGPAVQEVQRLAAAIAQWSTPLEPGQDAEATAAAVRRLIEDGGLLFDARLRAALAMNPPSVAASPGGDPALPVAVRNDVRVLLGALGRALHASEPGCQPGQAPGGPAASALTPEDAHRELAEATLMRQLDLAAQWLHSGRLTFGIPLLLAEQVIVAELRVGDESSGRQAAPGARTFSFDVRVELPDIGRLEAAVQWSGREISTRVFVDRSELEAIARAELQTLADGLTRAGFERVTSAVVVDPVRLAMPPDEPGPGPAGGTVFDARA